MEFKKIVFPAPALTWEWETFFGEFFWLPVPNVAMSQLHGIFTNMHNENQKRKKDLNNSYEAGSPDTMKTSKKRLLSVNSVNFDECDTKKNGNSQLDFNDGDVWYDPSVSNKNFKVKVDGQYVYDFDKMDDDMNDVADEGVIGTNINIKFNSFKNQQNVNDKLRKSMVLHNAPVVVPEPKKEEWDFDWEHVKQSQKFWTWFVDDNTTAGNGNQLAVGGMAYIKEDNNRNFNSLKYKDNFQEKDNYKTNQLCKEPPGVFCREPPQRGLNTIPGSKKIFDINDYAQGHQRSLSPLKTEGNEDVDDNIYDKRFKDYAPESNYSKKLLYIDPKQQAISSLNTPNVELSPAKKHPQQFDRNYTTEELQQKTIRKMPKEKLTHQELQNQVGLPIKNLKNPKDLHDKKSMDGRDGGISQVIF